MRLTEDRAKAWLRQRGFSLPQGGVATTPDEAADLAAELGGGVAVKALIPTGRRGKAGAIRLLEGREAAHQAAQDLLGQEVNGHLVRRLYVEAQVAIADEMYLGFGFSGRLPKLVISSLGGVDIEQTFEQDPEAIVSHDIEPLTDFAPWHAVALWEEAGAQGPLLAKLGRLTHGLLAAFRAADGITLEINPLAADSDGNLHLVGTMMEIDDNALFRHPEWSADALAPDDEGGEAANQRERKVREIDKSVPGGAVRYSELDGDIGLFVAGGGAGLLQHDMIIAAGGRPANHTDISPGPTPDKMKAVFDAIFENPRAKSLLIGFNHLQMAPADRVIEALVASLGDNPVDPRSFPIVVRVFGPAEKEARELAALVPGIHYLPRSASLKDGVDLIVELSQAAKAREATS